MSTLRWLFARVAEGLIMVLYVAAVSWAFLFTAWLLWAFIVRWFG